jgi:cell division transport system permease protein
MIKFYLSESLRIAKRSSYGFFVLIFITTLAITVSVLSLLVILGSREIGDRLKSGIEINVFLKEELTAEQTRNIEEAIRKNTAVRQTEYLSKEKALIQFSKETGEDFKQVLENNPLPNSIRVVLKSASIDERNLGMIAENVKKIEGVDTVVYDYDTSVRILKFLRISQYFIYPSALLLILLSVYLVYSNNKVQIQQNGNLYLTMKLIGGKVNAIRIPILLNGIIVGIISSLLCILGFAALQLLLTTVLNSLKFAFDFRYIYAFILVFGVTLGFIGSYLSSQRVVIEKK